MVTMEPEEASELVLAKKRSTELSTTHGAPIDEQEPTGKDVDGKPSATEKQDNKGEKDRMTEPTEQEPRTETGELMEMDKNVELRRQNWKRKLRTRPSWM